MRVLEIRLVGVVTKINVCLMPFISQVLYTEQAFHLPKGCVNWVTVLLSVLYFIRQGN